MTSFLIPYCMALELFHVILLMCPWVRGLECPGRSNPWSRSLLSPKGFSAKQIAVHKHDNNGPSNLVSVFQRWAWGGLCY